MKALLILAALALIVWVATHMLAKVFDLGLECDEDVIVDEPKDYDADAEAIVGVNHPTNRLTFNSRQVS